MVFSNSNLGWFRSWHPAVNQMTNQVEVPLVYICQTTLANTLPDSGCT